MTWRLVIFKMVKFKKIKSKNTHEEKIELHPMMLIFFIVVGKCRNIGMCYPKILDKTEGISFTIQYDTI